MMKIACIALLVAVAQAADTEAPVISLDTAYATYAAQTGYSAAQSQSPANNTATQTNDCELGGACALPTARAYDHNEGGDLPVTQAIHAYIVGKCGEPPAQQTTNTLRYDVAADTSGDASNSIYQYRGEYVVEYDATDSAGNTAEQVVFALIIRDTHAPVDAVSSAFPATQVCAKSRNNANRIANSGSNNGANTDGTTNPWLQPSNTAHFTDTSDCTPGNDVQVSMDGTFPEDCCTTGTLKLYATDYADIFGASNANNVYTQEVHYTLDNTVSPYYVGTDADVRSWISGDYAGATDTNVECDITHTFALNATSSGVMFKDASCECVDADNWANGLGYDADAAGCTWEHTLTKSTSVDSFTAILGTVFTVTYTATDESANTGGSSMDFTVVDTTPPTLTLNVGDAPTQLDVGLCTGDMGADGYCATGTRGHVNDDASTCVGIPTDSVSISASANAANLFQLSALQSNIIQHSAGSAADATQLAQLATHYSCTDDCVTPAHDTKWFNVGELAAADQTCDKLYEQFSSGNAHNDASYDAFAAHTSANMPTELATGYRLDNVGTYVLMYQCKDTTSHLSDVKCRTVINEDHTKPIMRMVPCDEVVSVPASTTAPYVDEGSICSDQVDGMMSEKVEVTGDVVNLAVIGTYHITYNCQDSAGNTADPLIRTVEVKDEVCPTCIVGDATSEVTTEASFPYTDAAVTCYDNIIAYDDVTQQVVAGTVNVELTGPYKITYSWTANNMDSAACCSTSTQCTDAARAAVACVAGTTCAAAVRTVHVVDTMRPIISLHYMAENDTSSKGWVALALASAVAGVALLGFSSRASPATTVPV